MLFLKLNNKNMSLTKNDFIEKLNQSIQNNSFIKCTLGKSYVEKTTKLRNIYIKWIELKNKPTLSFLYRYKTQDITKNFSIKEGIKEIDNLIGNDFLSGNLFTEQEDVEIIFNKKRKAFVKTHSASLNKKETQHNREKKRLITAHDNIYLKKLGIVSSNNEVYKNKQDKFKQLNKYIEIIDNLIKDVSFSDEIHIVDMGSGKGYLTFALYDYLKNVLNLNVFVTGIELRPELVDLCNKIAKAAKFKNLTFKAQLIQEYSATNIDILIALHACDTATDDAIFKGLSAKSSLIICAPCCHKQIRKQINCQTALQSILKHNIFEERQAEMITDGIRGLILEGFGYETQTFEFISSEHTGKNVMIIGNKKQEEEQNKEAFSKIIEIKKEFGIDSHYLETLISQ